MPELDFMPTIEMAKLTGWNDTPADRSALTRYLGQADIRKWLGGEKTHPRYPRASEDRFRQMLAAHKQGLTPKMMLLMAQRGGEMTAPATPDAEMAHEGQEAPPTESETAIAIVLPSVPQLAREMAQSDAESLIDRLAERLGAVISPVPVDRFMGRDEAAVLLHCPPRSVGRHVRAVRKDTWSHLDIQEYMAATRKKARDLPAPPRKSRKPKTEISDSETRNS